MLYNTNSTKSPADRFARTPRAAALPAHLSRSWLLTAPTSETLIRTALASEADSVVFDLEDGVPDPEKKAARHRLAAALRDGANAWVRINSEPTNHWAEDLSAVAGKPGLRGVMLAMTEHPEQIRKTTQKLPPGTLIIPLLETAVGIDNATEIARTPGVFRLAFGIGDFRRDTGASGDPMALAYARGRLVIASAVGRLPEPIDGPSAGDSASELEAACKTTKSMGMTGKLCLDAESAGIINAALAPSPPDIQWATALLKAHALGTTEQANGSYLPRLARARDISTRAAAYGLQTQAPGRQPRQP